MTRRLLITLALVLTALLVTTAVAWRWWSGTGRAVRSGEVALAALGADVTVRWDDRGVPYVDAASAADLATALGWLHANDRMTQMELGRRLAAGRLAELVGPDALPADRRSRALRLMPTAETLWRRAGADSRAWLDAYAAGVDAWLDDHVGDLPPGLRLLGGTAFHPEPWRPADSLAFVLLMAEDLSFWNGRPEEERYLWLRAAGPEAVRDLVGGDPHLPPVLLEHAAADPATATTADQPFRPAAAPGSNNWAIGGSRTATGAPLVANDPHLPFRLPGTWFQARLHAPDYAVAGMTLPGLPGVVIGRNRDLAWALTNVMLDDHDLFIEDLEERADGPFVRRGERWLPVTVETTTIEVRGGDPVPLELPSTDRGPLLPADPETGLPPRSLAWTLYETAGADPLAAFLALGRAVTLDGLPQRMAGYTGPAQSLVVAHRDGGLLWTALGAIPDRLRGDGRLPSPAWDPFYGWRGLLPRSANPAVVDPPADLLVTANSALLPAAPPPFLSADFDSPHRARRILDLLADGNVWTPAATAALQTDVVDLYALEVVAAVARSLRRPAPGGDAARALELLTAWDGLAASPAPGAVLFALLERRLRHDVFADEARLHGLEPPDSRQRLVRLLEGEMAETWFDDVTTAAPEDRRRVLTAALEDAWREAVERWGDEPSRWRYETLHTLTLPHPLGRIPVLGGLFDRGPFPVPGSATTVAAFAASWRDGALRVTYGPSMRFVADPAHPDATLAVLPAGQAGHPSDPHYDDQIDDFLAGRTHPFPWSDAAVEAATTRRLLLRSEPRP